MHNDNNTNQNITVRISTYCSLLRISQINTHNALTKVSDQNSRVNREIVKCGEMDRETSLWQ